MIVRVKLHATLRRQTETGYVDTLEINLEEGSTLATLLNALDMDTSPEAIMGVINRQHAGLDRILHPNDDVRLFPPISGG